MMQKKANSKEWKLKLYVTYTKTQPVLFVNGSHERKDTNLPSNAWISSREREREAKCIKELTALVNPMVV